MSENNAVQVLSFPTTAIQAAPFIPGNIDNIDSSAGTHKRGSVGKAVPHPPATSPTHSEGHSGKSDPSTHNRGNQRARGAGGRGNARPRNVRVQGARPPPLPGRVRGGNSHTPQRTGPHPPSAPGPVAPVFPPPIGVLPPTPHAGPVPPSIPPPSLHRPRHAHFPPPGPRVNAMLAQVPDPAQLHLIQPGQAYVSRQFISDAIRNELTQQAFLRLSQVNPKADGSPGFPEMIDGYHTLCPLEDLQVADERPSLALGVCTCVIKGISAKNGQACVMRRVDGKQVAPTAELLQASREVMDRWQTVSMHPNLVASREVFVTDDTEGVSSLHYVHDYIAGAVTAEALHLLPSQTASGLVINVPSEPQIWSYATQLVAATRAAHSAGLVLGPACYMPTKARIYYQACMPDSTLQRMDGGAADAVAAACRASTPRLHDEVGALEQDAVCKAYDRRLQVLISPASARLRISSCGVSESIHLVKYENISMAQREDLQHLGRLLLGLACASLGAAMVSVEYVANHYSPDLTRLISNLLNTVRDGLTWQGLTAALGESLLGQVDGSNATNDALLWDLGQELENGRLLRLLMKLNMVVEKPLLEMDPQWSETGDRYLLKLFRDFVFHQVNEDGTPLVSWGHMIEALNKLDVGSHEKIILLSRNEIDMLVVSYADMKRCLDTSYQEILTSSTTGSPGGMPPGASRNSRHTGYFR